MAEEEASRIEVWTQIRVRFRIRVELMVKNRSKTTDSGLVT